jgi:putative DNA primase/helicase
MSCVAHPDRVTPWTAATTGLQRLSAEAQDSLLALDGYPLRPDGRHVRTLLALGNDAGTGKALSERDPDGSQRWRRVILSNCC